MQKKNTQNSISTQYKKLKRSRAWKFWNKKCCKKQNKSSGDLDDSPSSWFSQEEAEKVFKEIPVETIAVYFGHGKENLFLVRDTEKQDISLHYYNGACIIPIGCIRSVVKLRD